MEQVDPRGMRRPSTRETRGFPADGRVEKKPWLTSSEDGSLRRLHFWSILDFHGSRRSGRACPCRLAGCSPRASCPPLSRRKPRFAIRATLGFPRRSIGTGKPSNPWISGKDRNLWMGADGTRPVGRGCPRPVAGRALRASALPEAVLSAWAPPRDHAGFGQEAPRHSLSSSSSGSHRDCVFGNRAGFLEPGPQRSRGTSAGVGSRWPHFGGRKVIAGARPCSPSESGDEIHGEHPQAA